MPYTWLAADLESGELLTELPLTGVTWGRALNGAGRLTGSLHMLPPTSDQNRLRNHLWRTATDRKTKVIYAIRDGAPLGVWLIQSRGYSLTNQTLSVDAAELPSYWATRSYGLTGSASNRAELVTHTGTPIEVARVILEGIAPDMGLDMSAVTDTGNGAEIEVAHRLSDGKTVGDIIADLSSAAAPDGFDYRVDLTSAAGMWTRRLVMAPVAGGNVGLIAKITSPEGLGNAVGGGVIEDERRANYVAALGAGDGASRATAEANGTAWSPRVSTILTFNDEADAAVLAGRASSHLRAVEQISIPQLEIRSDNLDAQLGTFHPGDVGQVVIEPNTDPWWPDGAWLTQRVTAFQVRVDDTGAGGETVRFTFDDPVGDF